MTIITGKSTQKKCNVYQKKKNFTKNDNNNLHNKISIYMMMTVPLRDNNKMKIIIDKTFSFCFVSLSISFVKRKIIQDLCKAVKIDCENQQ